MKTIESPHNAVSSTPFKTKSFNAKPKNLGYLISLIRDQIYSDKILAVIREYSCNAFDANTMSGKPTTPIIVTLPSKLNPEFKVRDYGNGLNDQDIEDIFISYCESTKRESNEAIGTMGIGSKSGFAYGDSFMVTSYNNGIKTVYDCILDSSAMGSCIELLSEPMKETDKEGIEITINVKKDDTELFRSKAVNFFKYWDVKPELVGFTAEELKVAEKAILFSGSNWTIYGEENQRSYYRNNNNESLALMGNIAYPINWKNVRLPATKNGESDAMLQYLTGAQLIIRFPIGSLQFAPSREALQYTDYTNTAIANAVTVIMSEIDKVVTDKFTNCKNLFEAHTLFGELFGHGNYGSGNLSSLKNYFTKKGLVWNGITITSDSIVGFNKYELTKGYSAAGHDFGYGDAGGQFPISRYAMAGSVLKCKRGNQHDSSHNNIQCNKETMVLLYDTTKNNYVRKACHYLMAKYPGIKTINVLDFKDAKTLQELCFKNLHLDLVPMIKYSEIMEDVRKTIVRYASSGARTVTTKADGIRSTKYVVVADNTYDQSSSYRRRRRYQHDCWNGVDTDITKESGHYVKLDNNSLCWGNKNDNISNIYNVCKVIHLLNGIGATKIEKIYGFGPRILEGKAFDTTKWIKVEDVITEKLAKLVTDSKFKWYAAFKKVGGQFSNGEMPSWSLVTRLAKKITDKDNAFVKLADVVKNHKADKTDAYDSLISMVGNRVTCSDEIKIIEGFIKTIISKYPMLVLTKSYQLQYDENDYKASEIKTIADYVNLCDIGLT